MLASLLVEKESIVSLQQQNCLPALCCQQENWAFAKFEVEQMDSTKIRMTQREPLVCRAQFGSVSGLSAYKQGWNREESTGLWMKILISDSTECGLKILNLPSSSTQVENVKTGDWYTRSLAVLSYSVHALQLANTQAFWIVSTKDVEARHCDPEKDIRFLSGPVVLRIFEPLSRKCLMY